MGGPFPGWKDLAYEGNHLIPPIAKIKNVWKFT